MPDNAGVWLTNTAGLGRPISGSVSPNSILLNSAQPPDIYQDPDREKIFPRVGISKWVLPVDDTHCQIIGWRHFNPELDLAGRGNRAKVGLNMVDFLGQTGSERSLEEALRSPGDYEAQVGQGPIAIHALETLGKTDTGVAMLRRLLRRGISRAQGGGQAPTPACRGAPSGSSRAWRAMSVSPRPAPPAIRRCNRPGGGASVPRSRNPACCHQSEAAGPYRQCRARPR